MITKVLLKNLLKEITLLRFTKNLQELAIEIFNVNKWTIVIISENFHFTENHYYNFRHQSGTKFKVHPVKTETYGKQSTSSRT